MARTSPHEERWAEMVIEAANAWGHVGQSFHDRKNHVVTFVGIGDVSVDDPKRRVANYIDEEQRNEMRRRCHQLFKPHFVVPPDWCTGAADLDRAIRNALISIREHPNGASAHAAVARFGRKLGIDGWEDRWRWAADQFIESGIKQQLRTAVAIGCVMWAEIGQPENAATAANLIVRNWDPDGPDCGHLNVHATHLQNHVVAVWLRDGRAGVAGIVEDRPNFNGNTHVEAFALAAVAAETGLIDELREQVDRLEHMVVVADRQSGVYAVIENVELRYLASTAAAWLAPVDPPTSAEPAPAPVPTVVRVVGPVAVSGATAIAWRGDAIVADTPTRAVALDTAGRATLPPPSVDLPVDRVRRVGDTVVMERADGTTVPLRWDWDEDQLEEADDYELTWAPTLDRFSVWGEYGRFVVFGADGSPMGQYNDHWKGMNYGVGFSGDRMMTWAGDQRVVVYDLNRRLVAGVVNMEAWLNDAVLGANGEMVIVSDNLHGWSTHDVDRGEQVGPSRDVRRTAIHPSRRFVAYADDTHVWLEDYSS